jgi:hypothetical protein
MSPVRCVPLVAHGRGLKSKSVVDARACCIACRIAVVCCMLCTEFQDSVFNLPLVAHAWRRVGFEPLMLLLGDEWLLSTDRTTWNAMQVGRQSHKRDISLRADSSVAHNTVATVVLLRCYGATVLPLLDGNSAPLDWQLQALRSCAVGRACCTELQNVVPSCNVLYPSCCNMLYP